jgi:two-component system OmpR family sensor kinase
MSLRLRVLLAIGLIAGMVVTTAIVTTRISEQRLVDQVDARLRGAVPFGRGIDRDDDRGGPRFNPYFVAVIVEGTVAVLANPNLSGEELPAPDLDVADTLSRAAAGAEPFTIDAVEGDLQYRVIAGVDRRTGGTVVIAAPLEEVDEAVGEIGRVSGLIALVVLAILGLVAWWVLRLGVRPVQEISRAAAGIADDDLSRRVPVRAPHTEVGELATTLNSMLDRLELSFAERAETEARLRRFVGDASHELRTPVQTIRGYAELYRLGALADGARLDDAMRRTEAEAVRMAALVDELLTLARFDQAREIAHEPVDLAALARDAGSDAAAIQPARSITVDAAESVVVAGDEQHLRQVFANLVGNALFHTPVTSAIVVRAELDGDDAVVTVVDGGPGMDATTARRAFERFFRADESRSRVVGGTGLGLAIVQSAVAAHGGHVELTSDPETGTTVTIRIPRNPSPARTEPNDV